jgi:MipA family protein
MPLSLRALCAQSLCLGLSFAQPHTWAADATTTRPAQPLWELGGFAMGISQQAYPGSDQQVQRALALPYFLYRGRVLRADGETAGVRALRTERYELDIGVSGAFGSRSENTGARRGMPDLGTLIEFGPRLKWNLSGTSNGPRWRLELPLRGVFDISDGAAHRGMAFEPELVFETSLPGGWRGGTSVSAIFSDQRLARTFYGAYTAEAGLVAWRFSASASRSLGHDWRVFGFARLDTVAGAANRASPLVRQTTGASLGVGVSYTWMRSSEMARD